MVLIHGFAEDGSVWDMQVEKLLPEFQVLVVDLPGTGKSEMNGKGTERDHIGIDVMAEAIKEVIKAEGIESCTMIGHSMGGYIALAFAEKYSNMLNSLGMFHSSAYADNKEKRDARLKAIEHIRDYGTESFLKTSIPNLFGEKFKKENSARIDQFIQKYSSFDPKVLTGYYYAMINRPERIGVLEEFPHPILFIIGDEDTAIPPDVSLKQCYLPKQSHVHILPGIGHMGMIEDPFTTSTLLLDYCRLQLSAQQ